jgi:hypothetical protein
MELAKTQRFYGLCYGLLMCDLRGLRFETNEPAEKIWQCPSFILLAQEKVFLRAEICMKTMEVN